VAKPIHTKDIQYFLDMHHRTFEYYVAEMFRDSGYHAVVTRATNDEGRDIIITKDGYKGFVECKRFKPNSSVGRPILQKLYGAKEDAHEVYCVTTSFFTKDAIAYTRNKPIRLINGADLLLWHDNPTWLINQLGRSWRDLIFPAKLTLIGLALLGLQILRVPDYQVAMMMSLGAGVSFLLALWRVLKLLWSLYST